ncbi:hypothetical protein PFISCL1PPCAC_23650, partial [Pristionchus fissidentatus]
MEFSCCLCCENTRLVLEDTPGEDAASSFKCCNGIVHVKTAALFAGISALILSLFSTVCLVLGVYTVNWWLDVILIIINTIVSVIFIWGIYTDSPPLIIPFIVVEIAQCAGFFMLACYVSWFTISFHQDKFRKFDQFLMVVSILIGICIASSAVWAAAKCYHYLIRKRERLLSPSFSLQTLSSSLSSSTLSPSFNPSSDYPWALGCPISPYRPPTPPRQLNPVDLPSLHSGSNGCLPKANGYHAPKPNGPMHDWYSDYRPKRSDPGPIRSTTVRSSTRPNGFPPISSVMTSSTPSFPSVPKRVSFSSEPIDHSLSMTRSLCGPITPDSRHYFHNDYTRPILRSPNRYSNPYSSQYRNQLPYHDNRAYQSSQSSTSSLPSTSSSRSSIARFPRFIDSVRVEQSIGPPNRCPSPYSNLNTTVTHSNQHPSSSHKHS